MKTRKFSEAMNELDDRYVEKAIQYQVKKKKNTWIKWGALAACLTLVIFAGAKLLPANRPGNIITPPPIDLPPTDNTKLPMLSVSPVFDGMGFEGLMAYDISEFVNANPWNEDMTITTLPVYNNANAINDRGLSTKINFDKMRSLLLDVADRLGLDRDTLTVAGDWTDQTGEIISDGFTDYPTMTIETDELTIRVDLHLVLSVSFKSPIILPEEYHLTEDLSYEECFALANYLKSEYKDLMGFENPQINISGGDYNIDLKQNYSIEFFDAAGSETEQILNYHFHHAKFYCRDGALSGITLFQTDLSEKVGDYPIITAKEAYELLSTGGYITSVPYELPGMEYVKKVELDYRTVTWEPCYMPYYKFYVELPEEETDGLKTYGAYYVPAVSGEYISDMQVWDGSFQ